MESHSKTLTHYIQLTYFDIEMYFSFQEIGHHVMPIWYYNYALESISQNNGENMLVQFYLDNHIQKLVTEADKCHQF